MADFTALDDRTLIEHARRNPEAFSVVYRRYLTPLYNYLNRRLSNGHEAEDIATLHKGK